MLKTKQKQKSKQSKTYVQWVYSVHIYMRWGFVPIYKLEEPENPQEPDTGEHVNLNTGSDPSSGSQWKPWSYEVGIFLSEQHHTEFI